MANRLPRALPLLGLVMALPLAAAAAVFVDGPDFRAFTAKAIGSYSNDGRARKACICQEVGGLFDAAGFADLSYDGTNDVFKVRCMIPQVTTPDGDIGSLTACHDFVIVP